MASKAAGVGVDAPHRARDDQQPLRGGGRRAVAELVEARAQGGEGAPRAQGAEAHDGPVVVARQGAQQEELGAVALGGVEAVEGLEVEVVARVGALMDEALQEAIEVRCAHGGLTGMMFRLTPRARSSGSSMVRKMLPARSAELTKAFRGCPARRPPVP